MSPTADPAAPDVAAVPALVAALIAELHPGRRPPAVHAHSRLDRDLGLDSLARVELLARVERRCGVRLSERRAAEIERVEDLLRAVLSAARADPAGAAPGAARFVMPPAATEELPGRAATLVEVLEWHAERHPERVQVFLYDDEDEEPQQLTFAALVDLAARVAAGLRARDVRPGEAVAIMLPTGRAFFAAFFGVLYAGAVPVPLYPPARPSQLEEHLRRQAAILRTARCPLLVTVPEARRLGPFLRAHAPALRELVEVEALLASAPEATRAEVAAQDTAFLQFTSGSTGDPKGVVLSHANLLANIREIGAFVAPGPEDVFVSWLPLYHDMGLIGAVLTTLYHAVPLVLLSPLTFLRRPERWLWAIHRHRGTLSAAPNFAYALCAKKVPAEALEGLDLSSWRMTLNGAEPISPEVMEAFAARFAAHGYRPEAMTPCYGLAECSLAVTMSPLPRAPRVDRVDRAAFSREGRATPSASDDALAFVCCGAPLRGHEVRVVDSAGRELGERREGRVQFRGPSATAGYFEHTAATAALRAGDGWLDSGDLGYLAGGELHVTGRKKDVIIRAGRNVYPHELEEAVGELPGVRKGCVAVFGAAGEQAGTEALVVLAETRLAEGTAREALEARIRETTQDLLGTPPEAIVLAPPHTVLKTSSGKVRRAACRALYEEGRLEEGPTAPWVQLARLTAAGWAHTVRERAARTGEALQSARFWGAFAPAYGAAWALAASLPSEGLRWRAARTCARGFLRVAGVRHTVTGRERLAGPGAAVVVVNHASYLDGVVLPATLPRPTAVVVKRELEASLATRVLLRRLGAIFVTRFEATSAADARQVVAALQAGRPVLVFPEGTCLRLPGLLPFQLGAFLAAAEAGVPVVPVTLRGTRDVLRPDQWFARRGRVEVEVGQPILPQGAGFEAAVALRDAARAAILAACGEPDLAGEDVRRHLGR